MDDIVELYKKQKKQLIDNAVQGLRLSQDDYTYLAELQDRELDEVATVTTLLLKARMRGNAKDK